MPHMENLILNPICPHTLSSRPVILSGSDRITMTVGSSHAHAVLSIDAQEDIALQPGDRVLVRQAPHALTLVLSGQRSFFQVMREKLGWVDR